MTAIEQQSQKIAAVVWGDPSDFLLAPAPGTDPVPDPKTSDPVPPAPTPHPFIDLIASIFKTLLPMLIGCLPALARPQRVTRMFNRQLKGHKDELKRVIDQTCSDQDPKAAINDAFLQVGKTITQAEVEAMLAEVQ